MNKAQQKKTIYSLRYQFGSIKTSDLANELYNKSLDDLTEEQLDKLFKILRGKKNDLSKM